ncbi:MAG: hypothetical protein H0Z35_10930 [Thermoanaerobacteraceae bacterium]|nr:hypothetical protein [Thermoanaerobacteraceae bacterium]
MMMGGYGMGYGGSIAGSLLGIFYMLIPLLLFGLIIYWAVKAATNNSGAAQQKPKPSPVEIAEERYARGEITAEELKTIRHNLEKR